MARSSVVLYESRERLALTAKIMHIVELPVKIIDAGKARLLNALGLVLSDTVFNPQSAERPADKGTVNNVPVVMVGLETYPTPNNVLQTVFHYLDPQQVRNKRFNVGQKVELIIDEKFRDSYKRSLLMADLMVNQLKQSILMDNNLQVLRKHCFPGTDYLKIITTSLPIDCNELLVSLNKSLQKLTLVNIATVVAPQLNCSNFSQGSSLSIQEETKTKIAVTAGNVRINKVTQQLQPIQGKTELTIFYEC